MAIVKPNSVLSRLSGKLSKGDDMVFYWKFGKNFVWRNEGPRGPFTPNQLAAQALFTQAAASKATLMGNSSQMSLYKAQFKAQSKYLTLNGFMMAECIRQLKEAEEEEGEGEN